MIFAVWCKRLSLIFSHCLRLALPALMLTLLLQDFCLFSLEILLLISSRPCKVLLTKRPKEKESPQNSYKSNSFLKNNELKTTIGNKCMVYIDLEGLLQKGTYLQSNTPGIGKRTTRSCPQL